MASCGSLQAPVAEADVTEPASLALFGAGLPGLDIARVVAPTLSLTHPKGVVTALATTVVVRKYSISVAMTVVMPRESAVA